MIPMIDRKATGIRLREVMDERGLSAKDIQAYLGLGSVQSVYHWLNGISMPTVDNLYALGELFDLPMDAIVRGSREATRISEPGGTAAYSAFCSEETAEVREDCTFAYIAVSKEKCDFVTERHDRMRYYADIS